MNGRKKLLCMFLLAFFVFFCTSVGASAETAQNTQSPQGGTSANSTGGSKTSDTGNTGSGKESNGSPATSSSSTALSSTVPSSAAPPSIAPSSAAPSSKTASSRKARKVISYEVTSSDADSAASSQIVSSGPESGVISLPGVDSVAEQDPFASAAGSGSNSRMTHVGILAWVCIGLGILVVLIVILSNNRPPRGPGRSRYRRPKHSNKKHLLNDKYYRGINRF